MDKVHKLSPYRWAILVMICAVGFMGNYSQFQVSIYAVTIMDTMGIDMAGFSMLLLAPMLSSAIISIPSGSLGDRFGAKRVVGVLGIVAACGALLRAYTDTFELQMLSMFLLSLSIAAVNANLLKLFSVWFEEKTDFAMGIFFAVACMGIVVAQAFGALFPSMFVAYFSTAIIMAVIAVLWFVLVRDLPPGAEPLPPEPVVKYLKVAARSKGVWLIAIAVGLGMATATAYAGLAPQMLELDKGASPEIAGVMAAMLTFGSAAGSIIGPAICGRMGKTKPFLISMIVLGGIVMGANYYVPMGAPMWIMLVLNGAITAFVGPVLQALPFALPEIRSKYAGSAGGIVGTVSLAICFFLPVIVSSIVGDDMAMNLLVESALFLVAVVCVIALPELGPNGEIAQEIARKEAAEALMGAAPLEEAAESQVLFSQSQ